MIEQIAKSRAVKDASVYWDKFGRMGLEQPAWLHPLRTAAISRFVETGYPTLEDEDWRFTNVSPITRLPFLPEANSSEHGFEATTIAEQPFSNLKASRLVFIDGSHAPKLSSVLLTDQGVKIGSLAAAWETDRALIEKHLGRHLKIEDNPFAALNTAFFRDGAFIYVPAGVAVTDPVHLVFISTANEAGATTHPRNLVITGRGSELTLIETYLTAGSAAAVTNVVEELIIGEGSVVEHCKFQDSGLNSYHIAEIHAHLGRNCNFISHSIATGAKLSRNNIRTNLSAEGVECVLNGLYLTRDDQLADHHMIVDHAKPHCNSHEYYNGILDGQSKGVFHGRILVRPDAQKTDAKQTNKNLLLSEDATIDTKPQLEIYADDVKCTHGATVGQLNEESIFYLRARGIGHETARQMLIHAFAGEIIDRIRCAPLRAEMDRIIWDRLEQNPLIANAAHA